MFYKKLKEYGREDIDIVGVGGIGNGKDAFEMILCGAKAVQLGTIYWNEGPSCFSRIANELREIMRIKGYTSIEDFRGKLKPYYELDPHSAAAASSRVSKINLSSTTSVGDRADQKTMPLDRILQIVLISFAALAVGLYVSRYYWASK